MLSVELIVLVHTLATAIAERDKPMDERQAAQYLGVSPQTVQRWRADGLIEYVAYPGALIRYRPSQLEDFVERYSGKRKVNGNSALSASPARNVSVDKAVA